MAARASRRGAGSAAAGGVGPAGVGAGAARQGRPRRTAPSWSRDGTTSCATSATATPTTPVAAGRRRGRGGSTATVRRTGRLAARGEAVGVERRRHPRQGRGPARPDRPGGRPRRPDRARRGHHRPRRRRGALRCCCDPTCPSTSAASPRPQVLEVEADLIARIARRAARAGPPGVRLGGRGLVRVDPTQAAVVGALAGDGQLVVVEGAAGAGKTTALRSTQALLARQGHRLVVVTPDVEGGRGRRRRDRRRRALGRVADPPARLALGRRGPLDPATRPRARAGGTAAAR